MKTDHGKPTDEPNPNGSTHARLNWWKDNCDRLEERNAELTELLATARDMMKQSHAMEVSALKKRNAELVGALTFLSNQPCTGPNGQGESSCFDNVQSLCVTEFCPSCYADSALAKNQQNK